MIEVQRELSLWSRLLEQLLCAESQDLHHCFLVQCVLDRCIEHHFSLGDLDDLLLNRVLDDEPIHKYVLPLAYSVGSREGLLIVVWVVITVHDEHRVSLGQVQPQASSPRREQEDSNLLLIELVYHLLAP